VTLRKKKNTQKKSKPTGRSSPVRTVDTSVMWLGTTVLHVTIQKSSDNLEWVTWEWNHKQCVTQSTDTNHPLATCTCNYYYIILLLLYGWQCTALIVVHKHPYTFTTETDDTYCTHSVDMYNKWRQQNRVNNSDTVGQESK